MGFVFLQNISATVLNDVQYSGIPTDQARCLMPLAVWRESMHSLMRFTAMQAPLRSACIDVQWPPWCRRQLHVAMNTTPRNILTLTQWLL